MFTIFFSSFILVNYNLAVKQLRVISAQQTAINTFDNNPTAQYILYKLSLQNNKPLACMIVMYYTENKVAPYFICSGHWIDWELQHQLESMCVCVCV